MADLPNVRQKKVKIFVKLDFTKLYKKQGLLGCNLFDVWYENKHPPQQGNRARRRIWANSCTGDEFGKQTDIKEKKGWY